MIIFIISNRKRFLKKKNILVIDGEMAAQNLGSEKNVFAKPICLICSAARMKLAPMHTHFIRTVLQIKRSVNEPYMFVDSVARRRKQISAT